MIRRCVERRSLLHLILKWIGHAFIGCVYHFYPPAIRPHELTIEKPSCINVHFLLERDISIAMLDHQSEPTSSESTFVISSWIYEVELFLKIKGIKSFNFICMYNQVKLCVKFKQPSVQNHHKFEKCQQKNNASGVSSPQQTPRVFSTTLASPAAARASASAAFKTAGWAASLGVFQNYLHIVSKTCQVVVWGILNQQYVNPILLCWKIEKN